jgi:ABC-type Na+ efflux pump permease subunit
MNPQLKTIILKEVKEVSGRRDYLFNTLVNIILFSVVGFLLAISSTDSAHNLMMGLGFIIFPSFAMFVVSFPFIQEKFGDEKLFRRFEALLTAPISLKTVWVGKITSIFLLSYPTVIFIILTLLFTWTILSGLNPISSLSTRIWILSLIIAPSLITLYISLSSWSILRFTHSKIMDILKYFAVGIIFLIFFTSRYITSSITVSYIINWIIIASIIGILAVASLIMFLITRLDKEKVTI